MRASGDERAVGERDHGGAAGRGRAGGLHEPRVVAGQVERHQRVPGSQLGQRPVDLHLAAGHLHDARPQGRQVGRELEADAAGRVAGERVDAVGRAGERLHGQVEAAAVDAFEGALGVVELDGQCPAQQVAGLRDADAGGGRAKLATEVALHAVLQRGEAVEAELGAQADDRRAAGGRGLGQLGDGAEGHELGLVEHDGGGPPFGRCEANLMFLDQRGDVHARIVAEDRDPPDRS